MIERLKPIVLEQEVRELSTAEKDSDFHIRPSIILRTRPKEEQFEGSDYQEANLRIEGR